jgi:hypothetical protein
MNSLVFPLKGLLMLPMLQSKKQNLFFKWIACLNAFVENEQWSVIRMKEEFHPLFTTILQITYQRRWLVYFSNHIAITFDKVNRTLMLYSFYPYASGVDLVD